jgi:hypothetical protein
LQWFIAAFELLFELTPLLQQAATKLPQLLAGGSEPYRAVVPLEQDAACLLLQSLDGAAQGGRADRHGIGALAEMKGVGEVEKQLEIAKIHLSAPGAACVPDIQRLAACFCHLVGQTADDYEGLTFHLLQRTVSNISVQAISVPRYSGFDNAAIRHGINRTEQSPWLTISTP